MLLNCQLIKNMLFCGLVLVAAGFMTSCKPDSKNQGLSDSAVEHLNKAAEDLLKKAENPVDEYKKLKQFEYKVFRVNFESSVQSIQDQLSALGEERWDCFHVEKLLNKESKSVELTFFCKRRPATPLRYLVR